MELTNDKIKIFGLITGCPEGKPETECPFDIYRKQPVKVRIQAVEKFSEAEVNNMLNHHHKCLLNKISILCS